MLFNVYYLNFLKVYEIKMMSSNVIKTDESVETNQGDTFDAALQAKMGTKFLKMFSAEAGADVKSGSSDSQKVLESFKVAMTKSLILSEVMEKCKEIKRDFKQVEEGQLVRIDDVSLSLENEKELRTVCFLAPWHAREFPVVALLPQCGTNRGRYSLFRRLLTLL